jgi:hypothetical protein
MPTQAYENAHSTPYWWCREDDHPYKGPIRHLKPYLETVEKQKNEDLAKTFDNINKWVNNPHIDQKISNNFWTNPNITDAQITQLLKFRYGQYMGNARKHLFWNATIHMATSTPMLYRTTHTQTKYQQTQ